MKRKSQKGKNPARRKSPQWPADFKAARKETLARAEQAGKLSGMNAFPGASLALVNERLPRQAQDAIASDFADYSLFGARQLSLRQWQRLMEDWMKAYRKGWKAGKGSSKALAISNPARRGGLTLVRLGQVTDRALRYRANRQAPAGPKVCGYCGSQRNVEVEHIDGREENSDPRNLMHACRSCNVRKANVFKCEGLGRKTRQYNPQAATGQGKRRGAARTLRQWVDAAQAITGVGAELTPRQARDRILATSAAKRAQFARELAEHRKRWEKNPASYPQYEQYLWAVRNHTRGQQDEGGAVIHAVPPAVRSDYARRIYAFRRKTGSAPKAPKPRAKRRRYSKAELAEVPF